MNPFGVGVHKLSRLCENSDAALTKPVFTEVSPVLSDQTPANRENSLCASLFSSRNASFHTVCKKNEPRGIAKKIGENRAFRPSKKNNAPTCGATSWLVYAKQRDLVRRTR